MEHLVIVDNDFVRLVNKEFTKTLIRLHNQGYDLDFYMDSKGSLVCAQNGELFPCEYVGVELVNQVYDFIANIFKYVHTVDTVCGTKGIMVMECIYNLRIRPAALRVVSTAHTAIKHLVI